MRISDWSSDVCSSDLQAYATRSADRSCRDVLQHIADAANGVERASGAGLVQLPAQAGYRRFHGIGRHRLIEIVERVLDHFTTDDGPRAPQQQFQQVRFPARQLDSADRKSVVSGKSVSVRVDLGVRRCIKNKKK